MSELKKDCDLYEREAEATKWSLENMEAEHSFNTDLSASLLHENFQEAAQIRKMAEELKRWQNTIAITDLPTTALAS